MKYSKKVYLLFILVLLQVHSNQFAQEKFTVGTFIASGYDTSTHYKNYPQVLDLGVNSIYQLAIKNVNAPNLPDQRSNLDLLSQFSTVWAANDSGTGTTDEKNINAEWQNIDWISYFTSAKYMKWEAEGNPLFQGNVKIKNTGGSRYQDSDGTEGWRTQNNQNGDFLIYGPDYWQYPRYTFTNPSWNPEVIKYLASFRMKIDSPSQDTLPVCEIIITNTDSAGVDSILADSIITTSDLVTGYRNIIIPYDYRKYFHSKSSTQNRYQFPGSFINQTDGYSYNIGSKVQFKIKWLGNKQLFVDYIEVYDQMIWDYYFKQFPSRVIDSIVTYDQEFAENSNFYSKLKYYYTMDEPHSIDGYEPLRKVQEILDAHNIQADLLTHWYPEWDGTRDGDPSWPIYKQLAQPKKIMFWYAPFTRSNTTGEPDDRDFTLYFLHNNLQQACLQDSNFFLSAQAFGYKRSGGPYIYDYWMLPDTAEISAETMLALAHGCKGIFYETYYTYGDPLADHMEGLVDFPNNGSYPPRPIWYKVKQLTARLNGELGNTLMKLNYTGDYLMLRKGIHQTGETGNFSGNYFSLDSSASTCNFHAGLFNHKEYLGNDYYYFLLTNQLTTNPTSVNVTVKPKTSGFTNYRFRNIEPEYNFDITFKDSTTQTMNNFPAGEGYLFQVAPVVKCGGKLVYNETVLGGTTLTDDMSIESGAALYVIGNYHANANITVKNGGKIICSGNGKITFSSGKKLVLEGTAQLLGNSSTDKLKLEFSSVVNGIEIQPNSSVTINNCEIIGAYTGIASIAGSPSVVNISNSKISAAYSCISLTGIGSELNSTPTIENCELTSTISGISVANYSEFLVLNNKLNNCGIYFSNVPASYIQGNKINGGANQSILGVFMNNCGGFIRKDTITNCLNAIQLANSSPDIGGCWIYNNKRHGIYIGSGSIPNLVGYYTTNPPTYFALSGYNKIDANGLQTSSTPVDNDGSEIYLSTANILLNNGCNQISDDRLSTPSMNTQYLISGSLNNGGRLLNAINNYWGTRIPASNRYKNLSVIFSPYYTTACTLGGGSSSEFLVLKTSTGAFVDSISSAEGEPESLTTLEENYSIADNLFATGNVTQAKPLYEQIVTANYTSEEKLSAYNKLYAIGNLTGADENYFTGLQNTFEDIANNEIDTLIKKVYNQNAIKCDVSKEEYVTAINKFDNIIQQNPNSEEAVYAEIDILTTALNIDTTNPGLGKIGGGKYLVKGTSDYLSKLNDILQSKFGINSEEGKQIIPKDYSLHQNYPNPFNPSTTIKFDIPNDGLVQLEIFDILGQRITTLVNEYKSAGSYEHQFDASNLASGVYVYKLQASDFVSSKKMILLK